MTRSSPVAEVMSVWSFSMAATVASMRPARAFTGPGVPSGRGVSGAGLSVAGFPLAPVPEGWEERVPTPSGTGWQEGT